MSEKEEEFPFQQFLEALTESGNLRKSLKNIVGAICQKNICWTYSAISTLIQILKTKDEEPVTKCRSLEVVNILLETAEYPVLVFLELYVVPILIEIGHYRGRKSDEMASYYFQQSQGSPDTQEMRHLSLEYVERAAELIFMAAKIKPFRTVQTEELKEESVFVKAAQSIKQKGISDPKTMKWCKQSKQKEFRSLFLNKLKRFNSQSDEWTQFLLVNLLEEVQTGKKELCELRLLLAYGESFLTSTIINFCEEELIDITENLDFKKKYLGLLNELVRNGDIEAIIMVKNSQFLPSVVAHISKLQGQQGTMVGEGIFPEVKASKQVKKQFYCDFLRYLETWAVCMPQDYDSEDFNIKSIFDFLKKEKKFKFPENMLLNRYQKQIRQNLLRNKERNDRLLDILENMDGSKQQSISRTAKSKMSNVLHKTTLLVPDQLEVKLQEIKRSLKELISGQEQADRAFKILTQFKDNWITYLQSLDFEGADEDKLEELVNNGEKSVEQIQLVVPIYGNLEKGKIGFKEFKQKIIEALEFHNDVSNASMCNKSHLDKSKSFRSKYGKSNLGKSNLGKSTKMGKSLLDKIKAKSRIGDKTRMNMSKAMDRSNLLEKSRNNIMETSVRKTQEKKEDSRTLNFKKGKMESDDEEESMTEHYKIQEKKTEKIIAVEKVESPTKKQSSIVNDLQTERKKEISRLAEKKEESEEDQRVIRVADYEVEAGPSKHHPKNARGSMLRDKSKNSGSRLVLRNNSRIERSSNSKMERSGHSESRLSVGRRSISGRRVKQSSLQRRSEIDQDKTRKLSEQSLQKDERSRVKEASRMETKELNVLASNVEENKLPLKTKGNFNDFNSEAGEISSIHSTSGVIHHSEEKALNLTNQVSEINPSKDLARMREKEKEREKERDVEIAPPLVGDYYEQAQKKTRDQEGYRKKTKEESRLTQKSNDNPKFMQVFQKDNEYADRNDFRLMKKKEIPSTTHHLKVQPRREEIHTTKHISFPKKNEDALPKTTRHSLVANAGHLATSSKVIESKAGDEQKSSQILNLQRKIMELERESVSMKKKLEVKDNEIRSIKSSSRAGSERGYAHFTTASGSNFDKSSMRSSSASRRVEMSQFQREVEGNFKQYLERIKGNTFKKSLLKLKCLVHRTDQVQIGCLSQRCDDMLQSTLYVTPHRYDMIDFSITVIHDHRLRVKVSPQSVSLIPALKQHKIHLMIEVLNVPFCLPEFEINYKSASEYCSNYNRLTLPIGLNKFCVIKPLNMGAKPQKHIDYVKSDNFKLNTKVLKLQKLAEFFPSFKYMPAGKGREWVMLGATCQFGEAVFNLILNVSDKCLWWQGFLLKGESKVMNFLMCTFKQIIDGSKK